MIMQISQFCRYLSETSGDHTYLLKKTGIFPVKIVRNYDILYYKNKAKWDVFEEKGISGQFC